MKRWPNKCLIVLFVFGFMIQFGMSAAAQNSDLGTVIPTPETTSATNSAENENRHKSALEAISEFGKESQLQIRLSLLNRYATNEIAVRLNKLVELSALISSSTYLSQVEKTALQAEVDAQTQGLTDLGTQIKNQISSATEINDELKNNVRNIVNAHRVYSALEPKIRGLATSGFLAQIVIRALNFSDKLDRLITETKSGGGDVTELEVLAQTFKDTLALAKTQGVNARKEFGALSVSGDYDTNRAHLDAGKTYLRFAKDSLKNTKELLKDILREMSEVSTPTPSAEAIPSVQ